MKLNILLGLLFGLASSIAAADTRVNVVGLFSDKALISINGAAPQSIRAGQTLNGVKLVSANSEVATFMVEGKRLTLKMGQAMSTASSGASEANTPVKLFADSRGHFYGTMQINGASLKYVVDTGATTVALNSADAKQANIDYQKGEKIQVSTANGLTGAYALKVNTVRLGTIELHNVEVTVTEGGSPPFVLLGMSALNRLDMQRDSSVMTLTKKY